MNLLIFEFTKKKQRFFIVRKKNHFSKKKMDFGRKVLFVDSDSEIDIEDCEDEWSSSSDEDESKVMKSRKKIYKSWQFFPMFLTWKDIQSILEKEGMEPRKTGLPSLKQLLAIFQISKKRQRKKELSYLGLKPSDLKYYLQPKDNTTEMKKIWELQETIQEEEDIKKSIQMEDDLKIFQKRILEPVRKFKNFISNVVVNCGKQSYVLNVVKCKMSSIPSVKPYKLWYKLDFMYDIATQSGGAFLDVDSIEGLCDDNELTRMCFEYLSLDEDTIFEQLGNGVTSCCYQRGILKLLPFLNNLGIPNQTSENYEGYKHEYVVTSKQEIATQLEQFECFILRPSQGLKKEQHIAKSRKNQLKGIEKWIHSQKLIVPCFTHPSCGYIVNVVQDKKVWTDMSSKTFANVPSNMSYKISVTPLNNLKKEIYCFPHVTRFSNLLIEWLVTPGYPRTMYKAIATCLAEIGT